MRNFDFTGVDRALVKMPGLLTNRAGQMGMGSVVGVVQGSLPGEVSDDGGDSVSPNNIDLGHGLMIAMGTGVPSFGALRHIIAWACIIGLFAWNWRQTYVVVSNAFSANQTRTAGTDVLGTNINISSALAMAVVIFAAITAIPVLALSFLTGEVSLWTSLPNPINSLSGMGWAYHFLNQYIPFVTVCSSVMVRLVFMVAIQSVGSVVMGIKLFLVGL